MPAQYEIHTSTTKSILLIEYSVEHLAGYCVIMRDITLMQHQLNWQNLQQRRKLLEYYYYTKSFTIICTSGTTLLYSKPL